MLAYPDTELTDATVTLRHWRTTDLRCIEEASLDPSIPRGTTVPARFTDAAGLAFVERQWGRQESGEGLSLAIAEASSGEAVGAIVLIVREEPETVGIGYWLIPRARGRRLAAHAVGLLAPWALAQVGIDRIEALVGSENIASRRVLFGNGFLQESGLRTWIGSDGESEELLVYSLHFADRDRDEP